MSQENVLVSFVGQKISKLCWCTYRDGSISSNEFISGGWDDQVNSICLWRIPEDGGDISISTEPFVLTQKEVELGLYYTN